jgi:hypothetical protein
MTTAKNEKQIHVNLLNISIKLASHVVHVGKTCIKN